MAQKLISKEDQIKKVPCFNNLGKRQLSEIIQIADIAEVPAGEVLAKERALAYEFALILEGQSKVEKGGKVVSHLCQNDFFGEIALIGHQAHTATVIAETDMKLLVVEKRYFDTLLEKAPSLWKEIAVTLCNHNQIPDGAS